MAYIPPNPNGQATSANSAPVVIASDQAGIPIANSDGSATATVLPQGSETGLRVRSIPQKVDRISFVKAISNNVDTTWGGLVGAIGSGQGVNQTGGNLVITTGTTVNVETIIRSTKSYSGAVRIRAKTILSQRIANNTFYIELVDVIQDAASITISSATAVTVTFTTNPFDATSVGQSMYLGKYSGTGTFIPGRYTIASVSGSTVTYTVAGFAVGSGTVSVFGWNYYHLLYDSTTATNAKFDTQRRGYNTGDTAATINTTASPGHLAIITANDMSAVLADQVVASATTVRTTIRASRDENVPDDAPALYLQIRTANGSTAPASTTTWTVGYVAVSNFSGQDVVVQDTRQSPNVPLTVDVMRSVTIATTGTISSGTITANGGTPFTTPVVATTGDTGAKTATFNGATQTNASGKGAHILINLGTVSGTSPTLVANIQGSADGGTTWFNIPDSTTATITATGTYSILIYTGITPQVGTATAGSVASVSQMLPKTWRVVYTIGGTTPSFTITNVQVNYYL